MHNPHVIKIKAKEMTVENIEQYYIELQEKKKFDVLCRLLDIQSPELAIVFGRTKKRVDELAEALIKRGYFAEGIHGDLTQAKRDQVIRKFKDKSIEILVATDVAARGLDISGVTHVYNFDIPQDPESYVHRIGRTGRAGHAGMAFTFVTPRERGHLKMIEQVTKKKIIKRPIPTYQELLVGQRQAAVEKLLITAEEGKITEYVHVAEQLLSETDSVQLVAAALKLLTKEPNTTPVQITALEPLRVKKVRGNARKRVRKRKKMKQR
jgi:ATP-dependent RNA helicase DeaD